MSFRIAKRLAVLEAPHGLLKTDAVDGSFQLVALNSHELGTRCRTGAVHRIGFGKTVRRPHGNDGSARDRSVCRRPELGPRLGRGRVAHRSDQPRLSAIRRPPGRPVLTRQCEDREFHDVHTWRNPCGHIDRYSAVLREAGVYTGSERVTNGWAGPGWAGRTQADI